MTMRELRDDVGRMAALQLQWTAAWHETQVEDAEERSITGETVAGGGTGEASLERLVEAEHRANFQLWHEEDKARDPRASDAEVAGVKRAIDGLNQRRNDGMERIDEWMMARMGAQREEAVLHSETAGMMVDRLSILALKIFHTREQTLREDVGEEHRERSRRRLAVLEEQRVDLAAALDEVLRAIAAGERRVKVYRQMKMYNDPELNPRIYGQGRG